MRARALAGAIAALLLAGAAVVALRPPPGGPRLVLLYATCTVNRNYIFPYNPKVAYTPNLAAFTARGLVFDADHTEEGQSGIAYASLFTGNQAMRHGIYYHPLRLSDSNYLIFEAYRDAGWDTFFWADHPMASPELNYAQGVPAKNLYWKKRPKVAPKRELFLHAEDPRFEVLLRRLRQNPNYRALVITNFTVTHAPYATEHLEAFCASYPAQCEGWNAEEKLKYRRLLNRNMIGFQYAYDDTLRELDLSSEDVERVSQFADLAYKSNIHHLDDLFGGVVARIDEYGLADQSLIAFTSDHGEIMSPNNPRVHWNHGFALSPEDILVPLVLRGPPVKRGRYHGVTRSIDVFPTLAGLSGVPIPEGTTMGVDLSDAVRGKVEPPQLRAFSHTSMLSDSLMHGLFATISKPFPSRDPATMWVSVRDGDRAYKLTSNDGSTFLPHVYDWKIDAAERRDLYDANDAAQAEVVKQLAEYKEHLVEGWSYWQAAGEGRLPSEREKELLRSLGYLQ
jgi:arylsulfatase A-like enzyme